MADVDSVVITSAPAAAAPEGHDDKMVALVDGVTNAPKDLLEGGAPVSRPEWLPEKFQSVEDMAKAYAELEAKLGGKPQDSPQTDPTNANTNANANANQTEQNPEQALSEKGLDLSTFTTEFNSKGELSAESYAKLAAAGFDKGIVDNYINGQKAMMAQYETSVTAEVGGAEKYAEITAWAKTNLTDAEINAYNNAVSSGDMAQAKLAVLGLSAKFSKANGSEPRLVQGRTSSASGDVFESTAQLTEAMRDPRYAKDPAYRSKVQAKLARSNVI